MASALFAQLQGQPLEDWIADQRDAGKSLRAIAAELSDLTDGAVEVSPQTVLNWHWSAQQEGAAA